MSRSDVRVGVLTAVMGAAVAAIMVLHVDVLPAPSDAIDVPLWGVIIAFAAAETFVFNIHAGRRSRFFTSFSLAELPLVLGLVFVAPVHLVVGRMLGGLFAVAGPRRQTPLKAVFNVLLFGLEAATAVSLYHVLLRGADPGSPTGWGATLGAVALAGLLGVVLVQAAITLHQRSWQPRMLGHLLATSAVAIGTNTLLGLLGVTVLLADVQAAWLIVGTAVLLSIAARGYGDLRRKHAHMEALHDFTGAVSRTDPGTSSVRSLLDRTREILRSDTAEIITLTSPARRGAQRQRLSGGGDLVTWEAALGADSALLEALAHPRLVLLARKGRAEGSRALLTELGMRDGLVVPLRVVGDEHVILVAGDRLGDVEPFRLEDLRLLDTIANHVSVALDNDRLVQRLRQEAADKRHQALHDALTGLPNRTLFHEHVQRAVLTARGTSAHVAVMLLDLDRFKEVNDTLGHHIGDELLQEVGARLRENVKATDTVARLGGDEFAVLLPDLASGAEALLVAERARAALEQPFQIGSLTLVVGASLGIAIAPEHGDLATVLLQRADVAMYAAKADQRGVEVYSPAVDTHSPRRLAMVGELRTALTQELLEVHYQPKADARTGRVLGAEALLRWHHPTDGFVSPDEFIPIAERTGMIHELTSYVLRRALEQCRDWRRAGAKLDVAVNVSVASLLNLEFPEDVRRLLDEASVAPRSLTLEITESSIMADPARSIRVLSALSAMGVQLAIDDFGTGYSSLSQLKRLPVDELKIDRSFISDMISDDDDATIVRSTIDLGHNLGLRLVAEGVEDAESWRRLRALGCDVVQGYHLSRALEPTAFARWLADWAAGAEQTIAPPADERRRGLDLSHEGLEGPGHLGAP